MALALTVNSGESVHVGKARLTVGDVHEQGFAVRVDGGKPFQITDRHATEVIPDVWVSSGGFVNFSAAKMTIDAPRAVTILREGVSDAATGIHG